MPPRWPGPRYEVHTAFQAPLPFVYRWCTDFAAIDPDLGTGGYQRRIIRRAHRSVCFEDLYDSEEGWIWIRRSVRLDPPAHWHSDSVGSDRLISVDYRLTSLSENSTELTISAVRRPYGIGKKNPTKLRWERDVAANWAGFARALERDFASLKSRSRK
jgi:hypothetical protein